MIDIVSFTAKGAETAGHLKEALLSENRMARTSDRFGLKKAEAEGKDSPLSLSAWTEKAWREAEALIFVGAAGIAVRSIASYVKDKLRDPAVLVIDEKGNYIIPILSGHYGGGSELAILLSKKIGGTAVLTTATDVEGLFAVDVFARANQLVIGNREGIRKVSSCLLSGGTVSFSIEGGYSGECPDNVEILDKKAASPEGCCQKEPGPYGQGPDSTLDKERLFIKTKNPCCSVHIGIHEDTAAWLFLIPRVVHIGLGCKRGVPAEDIENAVNAILSHAGVDFRAVKDICSVDRKADEGGIISFARTKELPFRTFTAEELNSLKGDFTSSDFVRETIGVDNVCERAALMGCSRGGKIIVPKKVFPGIAIALAVEDWEVHF